MLRTRRRRPSAKHDGGGGGERSDSQWNDGSTDGFTDLSVNGRTHHTIVYSVKSARFGEITVQWVHESFSKKGLFLKTFSIKNFFGKFHIQFSYFTFECRTFPLFAFVTSIPSFYFVIRYSKVFFLNFKNVLFSIPPRTSLVFS